MTLRYVRGSRPIPSVRATHCRKSANTFTGTPIDIPKSRKPITWTILTKSSLASSCSFLPPNARSAEQVIAHFLPQTAPLSHTNSRREIHMALLDSVRDLLKQYSAGGVANTANAAEHFDQVSKVAPPQAIADGLSAVFRSDQTPAFGNLVGFVVQPIERRAKGRTAESVAVFRQSSNPVVIGWGRRTCQSAGRWPACHARASAG